MIKPYYHQANLITNSGYTSCFHHGSVMLHPHFWVTLTLRLGNFHNKRTVPERPGHETYCCSARCREVWPCTYNSFAYFGEIDWWSNENSRIACRNAGNRGKARVWNSSFPSVPSSPGSRPPSLAVPVSACFFYCDKLCKVANFFAISPGSRPLAYHRSRRFFSHL